MRAIRRMVFGVGTVIAAFILLSPGIAHAAVTVQLDRSSAPAGSTITIYASCETSGRASSEAFGVVEMGVSPPLKVAGMVTIPSSTKPGTYAVNVLCLDKTEGTTNLTVTPAGRPPTGDGGASSGPDMTLIGGGVGLIALAVLGGGLMLMRRRTGAETR